MKFPIHLLKILTLPLAALAALAAALPAGAATINLGAISFRSSGPHGNPDVSLTGGGTIPVSHGTAPSLTWNVAVSNQVLDGDGVANDSFTFNFTVATANPNGISVWDQGINNSNVAGSNTSFGNADNITFGMSNIMGTTTGGLPIVFDGFTGVAFASGGNGAINRAIDVNGTTVEILSDPMGAFQFVEESIDFAAVATILVDNQGVADGAAAASGTLVVRNFDLQFSSVPEPATMVLAGLGLAAAALKRRRN